MANEHRAPAHGEVHEFSALGVPKAAALAMVDDHGQLLGQVEFAVGTGGKGGERALPHRCHGRCSSSNFDPMAPGPLFPGPDCLGRAWFGGPPNSAAQRPGMQIYIPPAGTKETYRRPVTDEGRPPLAPSMAALGHAGV